MSDVDIGMVLDCQEPDRLAEFWTAALGYVNAGSEGAYVVLIPDDRPGPKLLLQRVDEPKRGKNRMHLDLHVADIETEATRLEGLGARRLVPEPMREHGSTWMLMADPEANEFCVCDSGGGC